MEVSSEDNVDSLDTPSMFPNVPGEEIEGGEMEDGNDKTSAGKTRWEVDDIIKLLDISKEIYFKTLMGNLHGVDIPALV